MQSAPRKSHRLSCGVVVVRAADSTFNFLLLRAFRNWDFPKGMCESGEQPLAAALREVEEETTVCDLDFCWGHEFIETGPYSRGKVARYYIARTEAPHISLPVNPLLGRPEHSEYRWVDADLAVALTSPRLHPVIGWALDRLPGR